MTDYNISLVRGDTLSFGIELEGLGQNLSSAFFTARDGYEGRILFQKSIGDGISLVEPGKYAVRVAPEDTEEAAAGQYRYDLEISVNGDVYTLLYGTLTLIHDVTADDLTNEYIGENEITPTNYGICTTAAATVAKVVTMEGYRLESGQVIAVYFANSVPASATMDINGCGAKAVYYRNRAIVAGVISAGDTVTFLYDGTRYRMLSIDGNLQGLQYTTVSTF